MHPRLREAGLWLPPLLMMGVIFTLSAMPGDNTEHGILYLISRKLGHFVEYALLLALWWRALRTRLAARGAVAVAFALTIAYAGTDELHQRSVEGRFGTPYDVLIDAAGAGTAAGLILWRRERDRSALSEPA